MILRHKNTQTHDVRLLFRAVYDTLNTTNVVNSNIILSNNSFFLRFEVRIDTHIMSFLFLRIFLVSFLSVFLYLKKNFCPIWNAFKWGHRLSAGRNYIYSSCAEFLLYRQCSKFLICISKKQKICWSGSQHHEQICLSLFVSGNFTFPNVDHDSPHHWLKAQRRYLNVRAVPLLPTFPLILFHTWLARTKTYSLTQCYIILLFLSVYLWH
jgi:hypothetical protein